MSDPRDKMRVFYVGWDGAMYPKDRRAMGAPDADYVAIDDPALVALCDLYGKYPPAVLEAMERVCEAAVARLQAVEQGTEHEINTAHDLLIRETEQYRKAVEAETR